MLGVILALERVDFVQGALQTVDVVVGQLDSTFDLISHPPPVDGQSFFVHDNFEDPIVEQVEPSLEVEKQRVAAKV